MSGLNVAGSGGDSWLTTRSDASAGSSLTDVIENTTPPVVIISSRVKSPGEGLTLNTLAPHSSMQIP